MSRLTGIVLALLMLVLPVGPVAPRLAAQAASCSITGQNTFVRDALLDYYFWYREVPRLSPATYDSPEAYLEALRYKPQDSRFSFIASRAAQDAYYSSSQFIGLGVSLRFDGSDLRVTDAYPDSPASTAGLERGDRIVRINGRSVAELAQTNALDAAFGADQEGVRVELTWRTGSGSERSATLVKRPVTIPTVSATRLYDVDGRRVGYILFRNFVEPSVGALDAAFSQLRDAGATELVLDLRYNGGGLIDVAQHLAGLLGGSTTNNEVFAEYFHNDRHPELNKTLRFEAKPNSLNLSRLVVITTRSSASASELIINALEPFMAVVTVGDTTYGKPVGQYGFTFCDKVLNAVAFTLRNAKGASDFFDGFPADCPAPDDLDAQLGDVREASLAQALSYIRTGSCGGGTATATARSTLQRARPLELGDGWRQLVGAY